MVEILKRGVDPRAEKTFEVQCIHCKSLLRFRTGEARFVPDQRDGSYYAIDCPVCGELVTATA